MSNVEPATVLNRRPFPWGDSIENGLIIYFISSLIVFLGVFFGTDLLSSGRRGGSPRSIPLCNDSVLDGMDQWDGQFYLKIAQRGYDYDPTHGSTVAFFPGYPALVGAVYRTGIPIELSGLVVAHLFLALALVLFWAYASTNDFAVLLPRRVKNRSSVLAFFRPRATIEICRHAR